MWPVTCPGQALNAPDDLPKNVTRTLNQGSIPMSMDFHPSQQTLLLGGITATNSYGYTVHRHPVFLQNSTISLCSLLLSASLFFQVAEKNKDVQLIDFVEIKFLAEQVEAYQENI
ncbi:topless-related protein 1-like [Pyrus communis]|uniref:topless-related protein 1-like n=1 Tax=Pyrus communis TaxID=23211 RepID=UPI0035C1700B